MDNEPYYIGGAPMSRNPVAVVIFVIVVAALGYLAVAWFTKMWPFAEGFRPWNTCPMHGNNQNPMYCNPHQRRVDGYPAPSGLTTTRFDACRCKCNCGNTPMTKPVNGKPSDMPTLNDLQGYAKNMWNSVIKDQTVSAYKTVKGYSRK